MKNMTGGFQVSKKRLIALAASIGLVLVLVISGSVIAATPLAAGTYNCLNPLGSAPTSQRIAFTGTLDDAQDFYQKTAVVAKLGNAIITQWTDGLPITVPTEQKVREILTGTTHKADEVMSVYTKDSSGKWNKGSASKFLPSGGQATVEKVAINAVMAGCKPEYLPAVLAMMSGGPNYSMTNYPIGYYQLVSGPYVKEVGMNAGQGAMNPGNPPSMTIGRAFQLCLINLGGAVPGSSLQTNIGNPINRTMLCLAEDGEAYPKGWIPMNEESGYTNKESVIMLSQVTTVMGQNHAPSSFRTLNSGMGGMSRQLGIEGKPGFYNYLEYWMQWQIMPTETTGNKPVVAAPGMILPGALTFIMNPDMALSLVNYGFKTKTDFYQWVYDRSVTPASEYRKYGWYDVLTNNGSAIEPTSGKAYKDLAPDYKVHVFQPVKDMLVIVSIFPGDENTFIYAGGRGIARCIEPWR
jgi:hypothetical protein